MDPIDEFEQIEEELGLINDKRQRRNASKRQLSDIVSGVTSGLGRPTGGEGEGVGMSPPEDLSSQGDGYGAGGSSVDSSAGPGTGYGSNTPGQSSGVSTGPAEYTVPTYNSPLQYAVPKTGYYCVGKLNRLCVLRVSEKLMAGIVPVTLVNERSTDIASRQTHAEYSGMVLFKNTFDGELPAVEYPKIGVSYLFLRSRVIIG